MKLYDVIHCNSLQSTQKLWNMLPLSCCLTAFYCERWLVSEHTMIWWLFFYPSKFSHPIFQLVVKTFWPWFVSNERCERNDSINFATHNYRLDVKQINYYNNDNDTIISVWEVKTKKKWHRHEYIGPCNSKRFTVNRTVCTNKMSHCFDFNLKQSFHKLILSDWCLKSIPRSV